MNLTYFQLTVAILGGYKPVRYAENAKVGLIQGGKLNNAYMISIILGDISYQSSMSLWKLKKDCRSGANHEINSQHNSCDSLYSCKMGLLMSN